MKKLVIEQASDCPFGVYYDGMWCIFPRDEDSTNYPMCTLYIRTETPCPLIGGLQIELKTETECSGETTTV
jgi:hypothetical protein